MQIGVRALGAGLSQGILGGEGHHESAIGQVVGRNLLTPPKLARDAPVAHVLHPHPVHILEFGRVQAHGVVFHHFQRGLGEVLHFHEPLQAELGLNHRLSALRGLHNAGVLLDFVEQAGFLQVLSNVTAGSKPVLTHIQHGFFVERTVVGQNIDDRQVMLHAQLVVVQVVGGGHFQGTGTEIDRNIFVKNHRNFAAQQRDTHFRPGQVGVARVVRIHGHGHVGHNRFGPRGSHD